MIAQPVQRIVRPLAAADRPVVEAMTRAVGRFWDYEIGIALEVFDDAVGTNAAGRADPDYEHAGVEVEGELRAWACWGPTPNRPGVFDLYWIVVHPGAQGQGLGTALLEEMDRRIAGRAQVVLVETSGRPDYEATRTFYLRHGYREVAREADHYAPGDDLVRYRKDVG
ncbi:MAG: GNAT family N-acetyltransferase [Gemmatimonadales bacterium]